jgi:hypothetical protein
MNHQTSATMNTNIHGQPTASGDISQNETPAGSPTRMYGTPRTGPREPLHSPKNIGAEKDQSDQAA